MKKSDILLKSKFSIPILGGKVILLYGGTYENVCNLYNWYYEDSDVGTLGAASYYLTNKGRRRYLMWFRKKPNLNTIVHECVHVKNKLWKDIGMISEYRNDEQEAYFMGYLTSKVSKILKQIK